MNDIISVINEWYNELRTDDRLRGNANYIRFKEKGNDSDILKNMFDEIRNI